MQTWYSPTKAVTGGLVSVKFSKNKPDFFLEFVKQTAFNDDKKNNFLNGAKVIMSLTPDEVGGLMRVVRTNGAAKFFHKFENTNSTLDFHHFVVPAKDKYPERQGFGFQVKKGDVDIKVTLSSDAAENLVEYLRYCLTYTYDAMLADAEKRFQEFLAKKGNGTGNSGKSVTPNNPTVPVQANDPDPEDPFDVD